MAFDQISVYYSIHEAIKPKYWEGAHNYFRETPGVGPWAAWLSSRVFSTSPISCTTGSQSRTGIYWKSRGLIVSFNQQKRNKRIDFSSVENSAWPLRSNLKMFEEQNIKCKFHWKCRKNRCNISTNISVIWFNESIFAASELPSLVKVVNAFLISLVLWAQGLVSCVCCTCHINVECWCDN